jgi:hypothetical protein
MSTPLQDYKDFIDGLTKIQSCIHAKRVREMRFPSSSDHDTIRSLISRLSDEERESIATLVQRAREGGIHDTLVFLNDRISIQGYRLSRNGQELPVLPFDTELYYDWVCRVAGEKWPDEEK